MRVQPSYTRETNAVSFFSNLGKLFVKETWISTSTAGACRGEELTWVFEYNESKVFRCVIYYLLSLSLSSKLCISLGAVYYSARKIRVRSKFIKKRKILYKIWKIFEKNKKKKKNHKWRWIIYIYIYIYGRQSEARRIRKKGTLVESISSAVKRARMIKIWLIKKKTCRGVVVERSECISERRAREMNLGKSTRSCHTHIYIHIHLPVKF